MHAAPRSGRSLIPEKKVTAASASGAAVTVLVFIAQALGFDLPEGVAAAAVFLVATAAAYFAPHTRRPDLGEEA